MIHSALLRYDAELRPIDDLAHCVVADDQVTIRCKLVEATFHDGSPVTAADVVFSYEVAASRCLALCPETKPEVMAADGQRIVIFRLARPDATFLSLVLPAIPIEPEAVLRAAYARLMTKARSADPNMLREAAERYGAFADMRESQGCQAQLPEAERLLRDIGYEPWNGSEFEISRPGGGLDYCWNLAFLTWRLGDAADSLDPTLDPITALADAYPLLDINRANPIGAGPWRFVSYDATAGRLELTAHRGYHGDPPATEHVVVLRIGDEDRAEGMLQAGDVDWWASPSSLRNTDWAVPPELKVARYPDLTYYLMSYNLRPGRLFHDKRLRQAMEYCIDKASTVEVATGGRGIVINSPVPPGSWAYQDIAGVPYDPAFGRALIEGAGWTMGDDGIYVKDGKRLSFKVAVRNDAPTAEVARGVEARLKFLELAAWKLSECGIELKTDQMAFNEEKGLLKIQGLPAHQEAAIDAALYGWVMWPDPDDSSWDSTQTPERFAELDPDYESSDDGAPNWTGFASSEVDKLLGEGRRTYDPNDRGRIYREYQKVLARELPTMFLYALETREVLRAALRNRDEPVDLSAPRWWWKLEGLFADRPSPSPDTSP